MEVKAWKLLCYYCDYYPKIRGCLGLVSYALLIHLIFIEKISAGSSMIGGCHWSHLHRSTQSSLGISFTGLFFQQGNNIGFPLFFLKPATLSLEENNCAWF